MARKKNDFTGISAEEKEELKKILLSSEQPEDAGGENVLRPKTLDQFLGQEKAKKNLSIFIQAAKTRNEALDHIFLVSPPGLGKTTLATVIANEMGTDFKSVTAPVLDKPKDLAGILMNMQPSGILFIDEIHRLKPQLEEMLYVAMEDFRIDWVLGQGISARTTRIPLNRFTIIGATTQAGKVSSPLYTRFGITIRMELYPVEELELIVKRSSRLLNIRLSDDAVNRIASCSRGTPRIANRLIRRVRDYAVVKGSEEVTADIVSEAMEKFDIDKNGLEVQDIRILKNLIMLYNGGPVGAETLAISVGESAQTLEDFFEPYLIQCGYLQRTSRGRVATTKAYELFDIEAGRYGNKGSLF